jgi:hypothetical protein
MKSIIILAIIIIGFGCSDNVTDLHYNPINQTTEPIVVYENFLVATYSLSFKENEEVSQTKIVKLRNANLLSWTLFRKPDYLFWCSFPDGAFLPEQNETLKTINAVIKHKDSLVNIFYFIINGKRVPFLVPSNTTTEKYIFLDSLKLPVHPIYGYPYKNTDYIISVTIEGYMYEF